MTPEEQLRDRLRKIAVLFAGAATAGERVAAGAAAGRIRERLEQVSRIERDIEVRFSIYNSWSRQLFVALCRRYGLRPYRYRRMHRQSIMVCAPESFIDDVLWPEYEELDTALDAYLCEVTEKVIREAFTARLARPTKSLSHHRSQGVDMPHDLYGQGGVPSGPTAGSGLRLSGRDRPLSEPCRQFRCA